MKPLLCRNCNKELTTKTEIEYSRWLTEYFCNTECATNHYYNYLESTPVNLTDKTELKNREIIIKKGCLLIPD